VSDNLAAQSFVIVGASLAGATAAQTLREEGFAGRITLVGAEPHQPYERPPLSKGFLLGETVREKVFIHPQAWYPDNDVDLRLGVAVTRIYRDAKKVTLADGSQIGYDALLLANGSTPRLLRLPGADLECVRYLRSLDDSEAIKSAFTAGPRVVIIGGGWIGLETAAAARASGLTVTVLEQADLPLLRVLGHDVARVFADLHLDHKVDLRCGVEVAALTGTDGRVTGVTLGDGTRLDADLVLVGVGITPNAHLAEDAGLETGNGILVTEHLQTSDPAIYAAGDVANAYHPLLDRPLRVEHWANARRQGASAAKAMVGQDAPYDRLPYFFSDQYDLGMEYTGYVDPDGYDQIVFRGDVPGREFLAFWLADGRVLAGMNVNIWDVTATIEDLITSRQQVDITRLTDPAVPLDRV
jgi:3-phenylpropionate/trans-cinnamate dioxygenase ferredoxin reductase component